MTFPIGNYQGGRLNQPTVCWQALILPYIEAQSAASLYDYDCDWCSDQNVAAIAVQVKVFQCPSTPSPGRLDATGMPPPTIAYGASTFTTTSVIPGGPVVASWGPPRACSDYWDIRSVVFNVVNANYAQFSVGVAIYAGANPFKSSLELYGPAQGVLTDAQNGATHITDIRDGTSNTLLFTESAGRPDSYGLGGALNGQLNPGWGRWADAWGTMRTKGSNPNTVPNPAYANNGMTSPPGMFDQVNVGNITLQTPTGTPPGNPVYDLNTCSMNCNNKNEPYSFHFSG